MTMKQLIRYFLAASLLVGAAAVRAEDAPAKPSTDAKAPHAGDHAKPELTPEQRKEARAKAQAHIKELHEKKEKGTLTDGEKKELERLERRAKNGKGGGPGAKRKKPATPDAK